MKKLTDVTAVVVLVIVLLLLNGVIEKAGAVSYLDIPAPEQNELAKDVHEGFPAAPPMDNFHCVETEHWQLCYSQLMESRMHGVRTIHEFVKQPKPVDFGP